jgi:hypothetical protein
LLGVVPVAVDGEGFDARMEVENDVLERNGRPRLASIRWNAL